MKKARPIFLESGYMPLQKLNHNIIFLFAKLFAGSNEERFDLQVKPIAFNLSLDIITLPGLDNKRQWQLFNHIRDVGAEEAKDIVCPKPSVPLVKTSSTFRGTVVSIEPAISCCKLR